MINRRKILVGLGITSLLLSACAGGSPDIVLGGTEADLGEVINGEVITFEVPLQNSGDGDLIIEAVTTSCGCTSAEVQPTTITSGNDGLLHIRFDSGAHGPDANGDFMRQIFIASNDPDQPEVEFRIMVNVVASEAQ